MWPNFSRMARRSRLSISFSCSGVGSSETGSSTSVVDSCKWCNRGELPGNWMSYHGIGCQQACVLVVEPFLAFDCKTVPFVSSDSSFCSAVGPAIAFTFRCPLSGPHRSMFGNAYSFRLEWHIKCFRVILHAHTFVCSSSNASTSGRAQIRFRSSTETAMGADLSALRDIRPRAYLDVNSGLSEQDEIVPTRIGAKSCSRPWAKPCKSNLSSLLWYRS